MIKRIIIAGSGGSGIRFVSYILAKILMKLKYKVVLMLDYDAAVMGGESTAYLVYSDKGIDNPVIEKADVLLMLGSIEKRFEAEKVILDRDICVRDCAFCKLACKNGEAYAFKHDAEKVFGTTRVQNMIALGKLLNEIGLKIRERELKDILPEQFIEKNIKAVRYGLSYKREA
ncbi:2-oxoacid:acceptor oxidoreductase family protein [archaeon]|nr:2-oxoacid:acceptor oxidoreductase family protein [archaeon]